MDTHSCGQNATITRLFNDAQLRGTCVVPRSNVEACALSRRLAKGEVVRPVRGVYARSAYWKQLTPVEKTRHVVRALAARHPDWIFAGPTAAIMLGLECSYRQCTPIVVATRPNVRPRKQPGIAFLRTRQEDPIIASGIRVTPLACTLVDCSTTMPFRYALTPVESALRNKWVDKAELQEYLSGIPYLHNRGQAMRIMLMASGLSENGGESEAKAVLSEIGFPVHSQQHVFRCLDHPSQSHRVDFLWRRQDGRLVVGEFDGIRKYVDPEMTGGRTVREVVDEERERQRCLERQNVATIVRLYYQDLDSPVTLARHLADSGVPQVPRPRNMSR